MEMPTYEPPPGWIYHDANGWLAVDPTTGTPFLPEEQPDLRPAFRPPADGWFFYSPTLGWRGGPHAVGSASQAQVLSHGAPPVLPQPSGSSPIPAGMSDGPSAPRSSATAADDREGMIYDSRRGWVPDPRPWEQQPSPQAEGRSLVGTWQPPKFFDPVGTIISGFLALGAGGAGALFYAFGGPYGDSNDDGADGVTVGQKWEIALVGIGVAVGAFLVLMTLNYLVRRHPTIAVAANAMGAESALRKGEYGKAAAYSGAAAIANQQRLAKRDYYAGGAAAPSGEGIPRPAYNVLATPGIDAAIASIAEMQRQINAGEPINVDLVNAIRESPIYPQPPAAVPPQDEDSWVGPAALGAAFGLAAHERHEARRQQSEERRADLRARYDRQVADWRATVASIDSQHAAAMTAYQAQVTAWTASGQRGARPQQPKTPIKPSRPVEPMGL